MKANLYKRECYRWGASGTAPLLWRTSSSCVSWGTVVMDFSCKVRRLLNILILTMIRMMTTVFETEYIIHLTQWNWFEYHQRLVNYILKACDVINFCNITVDFYKNSSFIKFYISCLRLSKLRLSSIYNTGRPFVNCRPSLVLTPTDQHNKMN